MKFARTIKNVSIAIFAIAFLLGCDDDVSIISIGDGNDAIYVDLKVGGIPIGSGIILDNESNEGRFILVTARHVVTFNRDYLNNISLVFPDNSKIHLGDSTRRWLTQNDKDFDITLLKLHESELPRQWRRENKKKLKVGLITSPCLYKGDILCLMNPRLKRKAEYISRQVVTEEFFKDNLYLKSASLDIGIIEMQLPKSMSGSPVICPKTATLVGISVVSHNTAGVTGFIDFRRILPLVASVQRGDFVPVLYHLKHLW